ncbi:MAG: 3'-5' exonuclease [Bacteroidales bacterium]
MYLKNIAPEELYNCRIESFSGKVIVIDRLKNFSGNIRHLFNQKILGFDTETKPSFRKGRKNRVSLLQLAFDNTAFLFRLNRIGLPGELVKLLSDPQIVKVGVAVHDDIKILQNITRFEPDGFVDLQKVVREYGIESVSLKKISAIVLGFRISKSQQVTDWEAPFLTDAQKKYAATDAWVCYEIYKKLKGNKS